LDYKRNHIWITNAVYVCSASARKVYITRKEMYVPLMQCISTHEPLGNRAGYLIQYLQLNKTAFLWQCQWFCTISEVTVFYLQHLKDQSQRIQSETHSYIKQCRYSERQRGKDVRLHFNKGVSKFKRAIHCKNRAIARLRENAKKTARSNTSRTSAVNIVLDTVKGMLSQNEITLLKTHLQNSGQKKKTYSEAYKQLVISISFKSTSCYKLLSRRLNFPPKRTLSRWLSHIRFQEQFDPNFFRLLKGRTNLMPSENRIVSLLADEVSLKELCDYDIQEDMVFGVKRAENGELFYPSSALVLMVTGVRAKWRQAVAFFFTKNAVPAAKLIPIVLECITKLQNNGLTVVNFTSDQGSNFSALLTLLGVSIQKPFFMHKGSKIFVTPDPPHLLKSVRNALMGHKIVTSDGTASWEHIKSFFEMERAQCVRTAPKLRHDHIEPPAIYGKMCGLWNAIFCSCKYFATRCTSNQQILFENEPHF
jgi:hypothetical protein